MANLTPQPVVKANSLAPRQSAVATVDQGSPSAFNAATRQLFLAAFACRLDPAETKLTVQIDAVICSVLEEIQSRRILAADPAAQEELQRAVEKMLKPESPLNLT